MADIYDDSSIKLLLNDDDKWRIIDKLKNEFYISYQYHSLTYNNGVIEFNYGGKLYNYVWGAFWGCKPCFSNIKYLIEKNFNLLFENGETDKLCRKIHSEHELLKRKEEMILFLLIIKRDHNKFYLIKDMRKLIWTTLIHL